MLPNESFYWMVCDALEGESEGRVVAMLVSRSSLQVAVGLTTLLLLVWICVF